MRIFAQEVSFLGHLVSKNDVSLDPTKVEAVTKWARPTIVTDVRSFLGPETYYRRFVQDFVKIASLLMQITQKGVLFV